MLLDRYGDSHDNHAASPPVEFGDISSIVIQVKDKSKLQRSHFLVRQYIKRRFWEEIEKGSPLC